MTKTKTPKPPRVRMAKPDGRPIQLRYTDPQTRREVRISTATYDEAEALEQKRQLEAKLLLGIDATPKTKGITGPSMPWDSFRQHYSDACLATQRDKSEAAAESRLDIAERIIKPRTLGCMASQLSELQAKLLAGEESRFQRKRSAHTVKGYMGNVLAALNWAYEEKGWLDQPPRLRRIDTPKRKAKGRPLSTEEFERMIDSTVLIVGEAGAASWKRILWGYWESGLRLAELLAMHWTDATAVHPIFPKRGRPTIYLPADMQKNNTEEEIPMLPAFAALLQQTSPEARSGFVFNPASLQPMRGRKARSERFNSEWVGKIISRIGAKAGVVVRPANERTSTPAKFASCHDLRRSLAQRLRLAGVDRLLIMQIVRHEDWGTTSKFYAPGELQRSADDLWNSLAVDVPGYGEQVEST